MYHGNHIVILKFGWTPMKIVGEMAAYGPVLRKISKCQKKKKKNLQFFLSDRQKSDYDTLYKVWMNRMKSF